MRRKIQPGAQDKTMIETMSAVEGKRCQVTHKKLPRKYRALSHAYTRRKGKHTESRLFTRESTSRLSSKRPLAPPLGKNLLLVTTILTKPHFMTVSMTEKS